jgi:hypothetical protein
VNNEFVISTKLLCNFKCEPIVLYLYVLNNEFVISMELLCNFIMVMYVTIIYIRIMSFWFCNYVIICNE